MEQTWLLEYMDLCQLNDSSLFIVYSAEAYLTPGAAGSNVQVRSISSPRQLTAVSLQYGPKAPLSWDVYASPSTM